MEALKYTKAFAIALSEHLRGRQAKYTDRRTGAGGCETCGYGASEYDVLDMEALEREIDEFAATFAAKNKA
jgi:hypothetical protein